MLFGVTVLQNVLYALYSHESLKQYMDLKLTACTVNHGKDTHESNTSSQQTADVQHA